MGYISTAQSRVTPKFTDGKNFKNLLKFLVYDLEDLESDISIIKDMKNMDTDSTFALNELGKLLGIDRPILKVGVTVEGFFQYGINGYGLNPYASEDDALDIREATDDEYRRLIKAVAKLSLFRGTIDDTVSLFNEIVDDKTYIINGAGSFDIIVKKDLTDTEKALVEYFADYFDILCVEKTLLGTISEDVNVFQYGVNGYGTSQYLEAW